MDTLMKIKQLVAKKKRILANNLNIALLMYTYSHEPISPTVLHNLRVIRRRGERLISRICMKMEVDLLVKV